MKVKVGGQHDAGRELLRQPKPQAPPAPPTPRAVVPHVPAEVINQLVRAGERRALDLEDKLVAILTPIFERAAREAARNFERYASPITASATEPPKFGAPAVDEVIDVDKLVASLRGKTDPVRQAVVETMMTPAFELTKAPAQAGAILAELKKINDEVRGGEDRRDLLPAARTALDKMTSEGWLANAKKVEVVGSWVSTSTMGAPNDLDLLVSTEALTDAQRSLMDAVTKTGGVAAHPFGEDVHVMFVAPSEPEYNEAFAKKIRAGTERRYDVPPRSLYEAGKAGALGLSFDVHNPFVAKVLAQSGSQIVGIGETTQLNVMRIIHQSHEQGLSIPSTAEAIRSGMGAASEVRARLIARTELAGAVNGGAQAAMEIVSGATGDSYVKSWLTAPGARYPRHETYDDLDGQTVALEEPFQVGDSELMFPGDPDGDVGEVVNCRCTAIFEDAAGNEIGEADAESGAPDLSALASEGEAAAEGGTVAEEDAMAGEATGEGEAAVEGEAAATDAETAVAEGEMAVEDGQDVSPFLTSEDAVYGPDPELLEEAAMRLDQLTVDMPGGGSGAFSDLPLSAQASYAERLNGTLAEMLQGAELRTRTTEFAAEQIIREGRFKSLFETGESRGLADPVYRAESEGKMFGYPDALSPEKRPIYGYLRLRGEAADVDASSFYGRVSFRLKDSIRTRTTHTWEDSLGNDMIPTLIDRPTIASTNYLGSIVKASDPGMASLTPIERAMDSGAMGSYVEAQYHGGLALTDVHSVEFGVSRMAADFPLPAGITDEGFTKVLEDRASDLADAYRSGDAGRISTAETELRKVWKDAGQWYASFKTLAESDIKVTFAIAR